MAPACIAVVGIDGAGKSTVMERLLGLRKGNDDGVVVVHCPRYHDDETTPLCMLSQHLEAFSHSADAMRSFELKAAALYLQMTLFGPITKRLIESKEPTLLLCERHPMIDTLAYGPFYRKMVRKRLQVSEWEEPLRREMESRSAGSYEAVVRWHVSECERTGRTVPFFELANEVSEMLGKPNPELLEELTSRYQTHLPDEVLLLDVDPEEANRRVSRRDGEARELHESIDYLRALQKRYREVMQWLGAEEPQLKCATIDSGAGRKPEETLGEMLRHLNLDSSASAPNRNVGQTAEEP